LLRRQTAGDESPPEALRCLLFGLALTTTSSDVAAMSRIAAERSRRLRQPSTVAAPHGSNR
jgi:hypothetical protein